MKNSAVYNNTAIISTLANNYTMEKLATKFIDALKTDGFDICEQEVKSDGFIFRKKRECVITKSEIISSFIRMIKDVMDDDKLSVYLSDHYDIEYTKKLLDDTAIEKLFDIRIVGRLIYIESDF